jgi:hypothetical protein
MSVTSVTDLSGKDMFVSGYSISLTVSKTFGNNPNPFQLASKSYGTSNVFANSVSFTNVDISTFFGCGVYCRGAGGSNKNLLGIHFSARNIAIYANWLADNDVYWVVYPGFSIQLYEDPNYEGNYSNILVNDTNTPFTWGNTNFVNTPGTQQIYKNGSTSAIYSVDYIGSIKVWYQNKALTVAGLS